MTVYANRFDGGLWLNCDVCGLGWLEMEWPRSGLDALALVAAVEKVSAWHAHEGSA